MFIERHSIDQSPENHSPADRKVVAVSACLLGLGTRYDGQTKRGLLNCDALAHMEVIPVCPEVTAGFGVPRPPISLSPSGVVLREPDGEDVSAALNRACEDLIETLLRHGVSVSVLKENSPSCGVHFTTGPDGRRPGSGVFTKMLQGVDIKTLSEDDIREGADAI